MYIYINFLACTIFLSALSVWVSVSVSVSVSMSVSVSVSVYVSVSACFRLCLSM